MVDPILQWFINLFTAAEWRAMVWLLIATLAATHTAKIAWRFSPLPGGGGRQVAMVAVAASLALSYFLWPAGGGVPWWIAGIVGGPASSLFFKAGFALLKRLAPDIAAALNAERREVVGGLPPEGIPERRQ